MDEKWVESMDIWVASDKVYQLVAQMVVEMVDKTVFEKIDYSVDSSDT